MDNQKKQVDGNHYINMGIQPWEIIQKNKLDYFEGNVIKYVLRWRNKDGVKDLEKAKHYIDQIIALEERRILQHNHPWVNEPEHKN